MPVPDDLFAEQPSLTAAGVRLVPLGPTTDPDAYEALLADPEGRSLTGTTTHFARDLVVRWLASRPAQSDRADWAVVDY